MKQIAAAIIISVFIASLLSCAKKPKGEELTPAHGRFVIDTRDIEKGGVRFFRHSYMGKAIGLIVARSGDGGFKTAFDACITCYPHRMGYQSEKGCVVCIYCSSAFRIEDLDTGIGNCVPIKIPSKLEGDNLIISQSDVEEGVKWF